MRARTGTSAGPTPPTGANRRVVAYVRVSTEQQADKGHSLEAQKEKLAQYASLHDLEIVAFDADAGVSASSLDRPGLQKALSRLEAFEASGLLVVKLDRLTRSVRDLCNLVDTYFRDGEHSLRSVNESIDTSSASGRMTLSILTVVSQWEREAAAERTAAVMQHLKATGMFTGGFPPYGFYVGEDGELIEHLEEQALLVKARSYSAAGYSLRAVGAALGNNPRNGKPFAASQIKGML